jgi:cob(I)alamin adenosyltransferase
MSISTKKGDNGTTTLRFGKQVSKTDLRIEALGTCDELNAVLGMVRASTDNNSLKKPIEKIQHNLFALCADLSSVSLPGEDINLLNQNPLQTRLKPKHVDYLEKLIIELEQRKEKSTSFLVPGPPPSSANLHLARTVCRRAERNVHKIREAGANIPSVIYQYLNRLSDFLWLFAISPI